MTDPNRPRYHFTAPANWLNDPNGLVHWQGRYHMFYQHNPVEAVWGPMHWGHADSADLVHWRHLPVAIAPQPGGPDANGVFSGCAVEAEGKVAFLYTGVTPGADGNPYSWQVPCLAWGDGGLLELQRHPANPVIAAPPVENTTGFRDHTVWKEGDAWRMAVGSGVAGVGGAAWLYESTDLVSWTFLGPLCQSADVPASAIALGEMWECPNFAEVDGQHFLIISSCNGGYGPTIFTGPYAAGRLRPRVVEKLDYGGNSFYAPQTFFDQAGRCLMIGWLTEARTPASHRRAGWAGAMSLPRQIQIGADGLPRYQFVPELRSLRQDSTRLETAEIQPGLANLALAGQQVELLAEIERGQSRRCGFSLLRDAVGALETRLVVDWEAGTLSLDRSRSSTDDEIVRETLTADLPAGERLSLHIFVDGSTVEVLANQRVSLSGRVYPSDESASGLGLFAEGGAAKLVSLEIYTLGSAW